MSEKYNRLGDTLRSLLDANKIIAARGLILLVLESRDLRAGVICSRVLEDFPNKHNDLYERLPHNEPLEPSTMMQSGGRRDGGGGSGDGGGLLKSAQYLTIPELIPHINVFHNKRSLPVTKEAFNDFLRELTSPRSALSVASSVYAGSHSASVRSGH